MTVPCTPTVLTSLIALWLPGLLHFSTASASGCDIRISPSGAPYNFSVVGACASGGDAQQACISFAQDHGYAEGYCHSGGSTIDGINWSLWGAGNLCESNPGPGSNNCGPGGTNTYAGNFYFLEYFSSTVPAPQAQCGLTCNGIADPINPASGAVYSTEVDTAGKTSTLPFKRFYNSTDAAAADMSVGWRHSFAANIKSRTSGIIYRKYQKNSLDYTALYSSPSNVCLNGFNSIKARVPNWQNAVANYANGKCSLTVGGVSIGTLPIFAVAPSLPSMPAVINSIAGPTTLGYDVIREDGQVITFWLEGDSLLAPPGISLRLQHSTAGFALTDSNDNVEAYDTNGKLLSITNRTGVVQTMSYDVLGRLSTVNDSFGHQISLSYDSQGRLSTVTRP